ncbi:flagellar biosynthesis sigma factor [Paraburkholderia ferrariae]|uniref:flagellar biosynthesis sigma factor n=1 Tax=Paraburkholderia ferrariae TaxID=386056 RepID=UPI0012EBF35E|nr:flagellar biosynthesis sigma factor [Paraburkholderia ferrariae]
MAKPVDEVVLTLGEPYEQVRAQSHSTLPPLEVGAAWGGVVTRPARFQFTDPEHGFITPAAKFLTVGYDKHGNVWSVTLSPQVETLPLKEALAAILDLQDQLRRHGWHPIRADEFPPVSNTPAMVESIRRGDDPQSFWQVAGKYQVFLDIRRFTHENRPEDERYLITLQLSGPPLMEDHLDVN